MGRKEEGGGEGGRGRNVPASSQSSPVVVCLCGRIKKEKWENREEKEGGRGEAWTGGRERGREGGREECTRFVSARL